MKEWFIVGMTIFAGIWLFWLGDQYGTNAMKISAITQELARVNKDIIDFTSADNQAATAADALRMEGYEKARSELATETKCVVTPAMSAAFRRITP